MKPVTGDVSLDAVARLGAEMADGRQLESTCSGAAHDGLGNGVFALRFHRRDQAKHLVLVPLDHLEIGQLGATLSQGAGLVEHDGIHLGQRLKRRALAKQHSYLGPFAGTDHDRGRGG